VTTQRTRSALCVATGVLALAVTAAACTRDQPARNDIAVPDPVSVGLTPEATPDEDPFKARDDLTFEITESSATAYELVLDVNDDEVEPVVVSLGDLYELAPTWPDNAVHKSAVDETGTLFLRYNTGTDDGVLVVRIDNGVVSFMGSKPSATSSGRFQPATVVDVEGDGIYEIEHVPEECLSLSGCRNPFPEMIFRWNGFDDYISELD